MKTNKLLKDIDRVLKENEVETFNGEFTFKDTSMKLNYKKESPSYVGTVTKTEEFRFDSASSEQKEI